MPVRVSIQGIQEAQRKNSKSIAALQPSGAFGRMIQYATIEADRYAVAITHVETGALRASHRMQVSGTRGQIYIDPAAVGPKGKRPADYGPVEHNRGGEHAFYARTEAEAGDRIARSAAQGLIEAMR